MGYGPLNGKRLGPPWRKGLALRPSGKEGFWPLQNYLYNPIPHRDRNPFPQRDRNNRSINPFPLIPFLCGVLTFYSSL